ncbi:MAG: FAD-dependent oxidoreductase [Rhodothermales bacterium]|nr:FAD-dependent oxidoreductase [Rhodothermales bacterium]
MKALVVGSGVIGLTTALRLQEAGFTVRILTKTLPPETTSAVAAALWYPYKAYPEDRVLAWGRATLEAFYDLAADPATGVHIGTFVELLPAPAEAAPWWRGAVRTYRRATPADLRPGYPDGFVAEAPLIETPVFLRYLVRRFEAGGGVIERKEVRDLAALAAPDRLVVHCTGLGARALCGDDTVYPIRGQIVRVANPGIERALLEESGPLAMTYIIPRRRDVVLGGTADAGAWDLAPDPAVSERILRNARMLEPRLAGAEVLEVRVGLRPARPAVRLEPDPAHPTLLHHYGHGGSGFTLCWGCADAVAALAHHAIMP